jgi:hypothetical protein
VDGVEHDNQRPFVNRGLPRAEVGIWAANGDQPLRGGGSSSPPESLGHCKAFCFDAGISFL